MIKFTANLINQLNYEDISENISLNVWYLPFYIYAPVFNSFKLRFFHSVLRVNPTSRNTQLDYVLSTILEIIPLFTKRIEWIEECFLNIAHRAEPRWKVYLQQTLRIGFARRALYWISRRAHPVTLRLPPLYLKRIESIEECYLYIAHRAEPRWNVYLQ